MKTIIAGSRDIIDGWLLEKALCSCPWEITEVVSGCARGVDTMAIQWAEYYRLPLHRFPADWDKHGKSAGFIRNVEMACNAQALLALWDGFSRGTLHMIDQAQKRNLRVHIYRL